MAGEFLHDLGVHTVGRDDVMRHGPGFTRGPSKVTLEFRALTVISCIPASIHVLSSMHNDVWWLEIQKPEFGDEKPGFSWGKASRYHAFNLRERGRSSGCFSCKFRKDTVRVRCDNLLRQSSAPFADAASVASTS